MKVIAILGSPRSGEGLKIIKKIEERLKKLDILDFEYLILKDINLGLCKGCFNCISLGENHCPQKDDRAKIEQAILEADGVILASPGYVWNVSWLIKNFMDRFAYTMHRPRFFKQSLMLVANGGSGLERVIKALSVTLGGAAIVSKLMVLTPPWQKQPKYEKKIESDIVDATVKFYVAMKRQRMLSPSIGNLIWFRMFKAMTMHSRDQFPADYKYYQDKKFFFYDTKVNPFKNQIAGLVEKLAMRFLRKRFILEK